MTAHTCRTFDPTCYRCDLARDEEAHAFLDTVRDAEVAMRDFILGGGSLAALRSASEDLTRMLGDAGLPTVDEVRGILAKRSA